MTNYSEDERYVSYEHEAVFPQPHLFRLSPDQKPQVVLPAQWGLTKRELFAAMAMQGVCGSEMYMDMSPATLAKESVLLADALLKELAK